MLHRPVPGVLFVAGVLAFSAHAAWAIGIHSVTVFPTCGITPEDRVSMEILVRTCAAGTIIQATDVTVYPNGFLVDIFVDTGNLGAFDSRTDTVDLGQLGIGTYAYTITLHPADGACVETDVVEGSFTVGPETCTRAEGEQGWLYWQEFERAIKRSYPDGTRIENLTATGMPYYPPALVLDHIEAKMYWTSEEYIRRANLDGTNVEDLVRVTAEPTNNSLTLHTEAGKMYWIEDFSPSNNRIRRSNMSGSNPEELVTGLREPSDLAVHPRLGKLFWLEKDLSTGIYKIRRADLDGNSVEDVVANLGFGGTVNYGRLLLSLDAIGDKLYWLNAAAFTLHRVNLDGTGLENLATVRSDSTFTLDTFGRKLYWTDGDPILRADLDGANAEVVVPLAYATRITPDPRAGKIYWTRSACSDIPYGEIHRANLDGSNIETIASDSCGPFGLIPLASAEPIPVASAWGMIALALLVLTAATLVLGQRHRLSP